MDIMPVSGAWPVVDLAEARKRLCAPGMPFETAEETIAGRTVRIYKRAHPHLRSILEQTRQWGSREFLIYEGERLSYDHHLRAVTELAWALRDRFGVQKGDRVAIAMRNFPEWSIAFWAVVSIGAIAVPLNAWGTGADIEFALEQSGSTVAFVDGERWERLAPEYREQSGIAFIAVRHEPIGENIHHLEDIIGRPDSYGQIADRALPPHTIMPDDPATIFYTSGTTGKPKGALGTHRNITSNILSLEFPAALAHMRRTGQLLATASSNTPVMLVAVPFFHVTGTHSIMVPMVAHGGTLVVMRKWEVTRALELVEQEKVSAITAVPALIFQFLEAEHFDRFDLSTIQAVAYGGAAPAPEMTRLVRRRFPEVWPSTGYGATEMQGSAAGVGGEDFSARPESAGVAPPVIDIKIADPDGKELPVGSVGEIWVFGPNVAAGYWMNESASHEAFVDGWYRSGDVGKMDQDGFVYLLDRMKDMVIRGGENIYCIEIENALLSHPDILEAAVIGLPHRILGEEVAACICVQPSSLMDQAELRRFLSGILPAHKLPVVVEIGPHALPRNASGKILKADLRQALLKLPRIAN